MPHPDANAHSLTPDRDAAGGASADAGTAAAPHLEPEPGPEPPHPSSLLLLLPWGMALHQPLPPDLPPFDLFVPLDGGEARHSG